MPSIPKTVLIVEDEAPMMNALALKLTNEGFAIFKAVNGHEGLEMAKKKHPDLILLDILLPKLNGLDVMKKLREDEWGKKVPIVLLTNLLANDEITKQITEDQPAYYLVKSDWRLDEIIGKVKQALRV